MEEDGRKKRKKNGKKMLQGHFRLFTYNLIVILVKISFLIMLNS